MGQSTVKRQLSLWELGSIKQASQPVKSIPSYHGPNQQEPSVAQKLASEPIAENGRNIFLARAWSIRSSSKDTVNRPFLAFSCDADLSQCVQYESRECFLNYSTQKKGPVPIKSDLWPVHFSSWVISPQVPHMLKNTSYSINTVPPLHSSCPSELFYLAHLLSSGPPITYTREFYRKSFHTD